MTANAAPRVLIVDDDEGFRETLRDAFEDAGYDVAVAADGVDAMRALTERSNVRIVILDLVMPRMSGREVYDAMQADPALASIPVIVATSDGTNAPAGARTLTKPLDLHRLLAEVARQCRR